MSASSIAVQMRALPSAICRSNCSRLVSLNPNENSVELILLCPSEIRGVGVILPQGRKQTAGKNGMRRLLICFVFLVPTMICAATAHLYNLETGQVLKLKYGRWRPGRKVSLKFPSGEMMYGEYSTVTNGSVAWGSVYSSVMGASASGSGTAVAVGGMQRGAAVLVGGGEIFDCEYVSSPLSVHGTGGCRDKEDQLWRLMF